LIFFKIFVQPLLPIFNSGAFQEEDATKKLSRNFGNELPIKVAKHPRRMTSLITLWRNPLWGCYDSRRDKIHLSLSNLWKNWKRRRRNTQN